MAKTDTGQDSFVAGEDLEAYRRVKPKAATPNTVQYADAGEDSIGVTSNRASSGYAVSVDLWSKAGTFEIEASEGITASALCYGADDGKIKATASGNACGWARETASGSGSVIQVIPTGPEA